MYIYMYVCVCVCVCTNFLIYEYIHYSLKYCVLIIEILIQIPQPTQWRKDVETVGFSSINNKNLFIDFNFTLNKMAAEVLNTHS